MSVLDVVEVTPDREFDVAACDDLTAQNRVAVPADAGCMVSGCHAGDVDFRHHSSRMFRAVVTEYAHAADSMAVAFFAFLDTASQAA